MTAAPLSGEPEQLFTVSEADALLPKVTTLLEQLKGLQRSIAETGRTIDDTNRKLSSGNGHSAQAIREKVAQLTQHQLQLTEAFQSALKQLEDLGVLLKDLDQGLVDFYARRDGKLVFLCWRLGEERIRFWHTLEGGVAARQPLT